MSKFIRHAECLKCGSENNLAIYDDHEHCFSEDCGHHAQYTSGERTIYNEDEDRKEVVDQRPIKPLPSKQMPGIDSRGLLATTVNKYQVSVSTNPDNPIEAVFPRFNEEGYHCSNQVRFEGKQFKVEGDHKKAVLFGRQLFSAGGQSITLTEGYYDAMAAFQMTGSRYPNVAVMSASTAVSEVKNNYEYLDSFKTIVINFDNDKPGKKAAEAVAGLFAPGKVKILQLKEHKDANDYLLAGQSKLYIDEWFRAPSFMPDGIQLGSDLWNDIENHEIPVSYPFPWEGLNQKLYGLRFSELVLLTADTGIGKTSICKAIEYKLLTDKELIEDNVGVGFLHLEEPKYDTAIGLMSIYAQKPYHLPDTERSKEELREAFDAVINNDRVVIWDHFGSNDVDVVLSKIRHMAALGCKFIFIDHLSIIVSDQSGDERKQLDEISTKLKTLMMNLNISVVAVIHVNRNGQVRGSAGPEQVANVVIRIERDKKDPDPWRRNVTKVSVEKNRFCGRTGPATYLFFNEMTNCLEELPPDLVQAYERGGNATGHEFEMYA